MIGYRIWVLHPEKPTALWSISSVSTWNAGVNVAKCRRSEFMPNPSAPYHGPDQVVPVLNCTCGLWAFNSLSEAIALAQEYASADYQSYAVGQIQAWGKIIEHDKGFRCQYAHITELYWQYTARGAKVTDERIHRISMAYDAPMARVGE